MIYKKLGNSNINISAIGLGCMGMSEFYGKTNDAQSIQTIEYALRNGVNLLDTADQYGMGHNEELLAKAIKPFSRDSILIATKGGVKRDPNDPKSRVICGDPQYIKVACEASLKRLAVDYIDLYYLHRIDKTVPIEDTMLLLSQLVKEGKIRHIGLSEVSVDSLTRANKVHPISAVQTEYSLWSRDAEHDMLKFCELNKITFVAYSPLGRGFLTGAIKSIDDLEKDDFRRMQPRFAPDNFSKNLDLVAKISEIAKHKSVTVAQIALAWVLRQSPQMVTIPGTKSISRLEENIGAINIDFTEEELNTLNITFSENKVHGNRYNDFGMKLVNI